MAQFCQNCGSLASLQLVENRLRAVCSKCGWIHYEHLKVSAGARVSRDGKLLLVQRAIDPWKGKWHFPSGYMEIDEDPRQTVEREVMEETGLTVKAGKLVDAYSYSDDPRGNGIVLIYEATLMNGSFLANHETLDAGFFTPEEILQLPLAGLCAEAYISDWLESLKRQGTNT